MLKTRSRTKEIEFQIYSTILAKNNPTRNVLPRLFFRLMQFWGVIKIPYGEIETRGEILEILTLTMFPSGNWER